MIQRLDYTCRYCHRPGLVSYDDTCPPLRLNAWRALLTCNQCHDYLLSRKRLERAIAAVCQFLMSASDRHLDNVRQKLERLTSDYAELVCKRAKLQKVWDQDFVEQLIEKPDHCYAILQAYRDGVKRIKAQAAASPDDRAPATAA